MKIALGADHRGYHIKERLKDFLVDLGHDVLDCGCISDRACDYPDFAVPVCLRVTRAQAERGILLCGSGIGMTIVANKVAGIRAALCHDELTAEMSRRHNDANILSLPADLLGEELMRRMIEVWLQTPFDAGRHARRVKKMMAAERHLCSPVDEDAAEKARKRRQERAARKPTT